MYHDFYQLKENPFNVTADPAFFFPAKYHAEAISYLKYGITQRKGILVVIGETGTGKTTLCRKLVKEGDDTVHFALILNPNLTGLQFLKAILDDFGIITKQPTAFNLMQSLNRFLLEVSSKGQNVVLIIDEAQNMSVKQLEQIRLLSNLETEKEKLLQIILMGQPELSKKLNLPSLRQLRQRVAVYYQLQSLSKDDIASYIKHRISKSMHTYCRTMPDFTTNAIEAVWRYTQGTPRTINILCDRALLAGFVAETCSINEFLIEQCVKEVMSLEHYS